MLQEATKHEAFAFVDEKCFPCPEPTDKQITEVVT